MPLVRTQSVMVSRRRADRARLTHQTAQKCKSQAFQRRREVQSVEKPPEEMRPPPPAQIDEPEM